MRLIENLAPSILIAIALAGCAGRSVRPVALSAPQALATPIPYVQNCAVLTTGTPSRFACNGKVYTSFQLAKIREEEAQKYAVGK